MKTRIIALVASSIIALPALAQTTYFGGDVNNGNLDTGSTIAPFTGIASSFSTGEIADHTTGSLDGGTMKVDLTANNGEGQWKLTTTNVVLPSSEPSGIVTDVEADVLAGNAFSGEFWVYVPDSASLGTVPTAAVNISLEYSTDGGASFAGTADGTRTQFSLIGQPTNTWISCRFDSVLLPAGTTHVQTRPWYISTVNTVNGKDAFDPATTPADWTAAGYGGSVYFDDFTLESVLPPDPNIIFCDELRNADIEAATLAPWNPEGGSGSIETVIVQSGLQSLGIDIKPIDGDNRWKGLNNNGSGPAAVGDRIKGSAWVYVPSTTTLGPTANFNMEIRSDARGTGIGGNGQQGGGRYDLTNVDLFPRDTWVPVTTTITLREGDETPLSSINTGGWNIETVDGDDPSSGDYSGKIFIDYVKLINIGQPEPGVMVDATNNNGALEDPASAPWVFNGAGVASDEQNHTPDGSQSVRVDLTSNNGNQQWKQMKNDSVTQETAINGYDRVDVSAWVYVPSEYDENTNPDGTSFGGAAQLNLPIKESVGNITYGQANIDLTGVPRDTWVEVTTVDPVDVTGSTEIAINNWNLATVNLLADGTIYAGLNDPNEGQAGFGLPKATPADWQAEGYRGVIYVDDIYVKAYDGTPGPDIEITGASYEEGVGFTIDYVSSVGAVDVYFNPGGLDPDGYELLGDGEGITGGSYTDEGADASTDPRTFYLLVPTGQDPFPTE